MGRMSTPVLLAALCLWGCGDGALAPALSPGDGGLNVAGAADADGGATARGAADVAPVEVADGYPAGPYAVNRGQIMPDLSFYDPWADLWIQLASYHRHPQVKALVVSCAAGWSQPAMVEAIELVHLYEIYGAEGFEIVYTLGETTDGVVPFSPGVDPEVSMAFMEGWKAQTGANYPLYADAASAFEAWRPGHPWPLTVLVSTGDMRVRFIDEGHVSTQLASKLAELLSEEGARRGRDGP